MPKPTLHVQWLAASALCAWVASVTLACDSSSADPAADEQSTGGAPSGGSASAGGPAEIEPPPTGGAQVLLDASVDDADPHCSSTVTCTPDGGRYCGEIGDGCGDNIDCGSCPGDWICEDHLCVGGPSCAPIVCDTGTTRFCGTVGDGCGHALECGACAAGETCTGGVCAPVACVPLTCTTVSGRFCGSIGDGCGHSLECGECPDGGVCGGGVDHLCWDPTCTQAECTTANGGQFCGVIGDGCGGIRDCGPCANDWACEENVCVGGPTCEAFTCQSGDTRFCGTFGDGCGRGLACGDCGDGQHCEAGICIDNACIPLTCDATAARYCGQIGDGCGRVLDCGECPDGGACGGGTFPNVCIDPNCEPKGCVTDNGGVYCGTIGDGCGGILDCNDPCPNDGVCGADDRPNICPGTGTGCINLQCQVRTDCPNGATTTLSGIVYDPAGVNPIFNALVYVPNAPVDPITTGATCEPCGAMASGQALTSALTDATGHFTLENVPGGADIPLVVQVGKWRRQVRIPTVTDCIDNPLSDPELTRLPSTQSEGDMPQIAVTTGVRDSLECLLRTIGIADSEFTTDGGSGRVHLYYGGDLSGPDGLGAGPSAFAPTLNGGAAFSSAETLWADAAKMLSYDIQLYDCEGGGAASPKAPYLPNFLTYVNGGGRAFLDHYHYSWLQQAELAGTANYLNRSGDLPQGGITAYIDTSFPKAAALADWMVNVGVTPRGEFEILEGQHSVTGVIAPTQEWIYVPANPLDEEERRSTQYMTFNTPLTVPEESQCGRVVFTDLHVAAGEGEATRDVTAPFPTNCSIAPLTAQGKALEFLFFDLSACIEPPEVITVPPPPPDVPPTEPPPATTAPPAPPAVPPPPTDAPPLSETPPAAPPPPPPPPPPELR